MIDIARQFTKLVGVGVVRIALELVTTGLDVTEVKYSHFKVDQSDFFDHFQNGSKWFPAIFQVDHFEIDQNVVSAILKMDQSGFRPKWIKLSCPYR